MTAIRPIREIRAPTRELPRYCPGQPLPAYRYVPGLQPHPVRDPRGHSFGHDPFGDQAGWNAADWRTLDPWLYGIDLFNRFYFWEAHEAWESLWRTTDRRGAPGLLLQGLIQVAAALLKIHVGSTAGASRLSETAIDKLTRVSAQSPSLMGLELRETQIEMRTYFRPLANQILPPLDGGVPILRLAAERTPESGR